MSFCTYIFNKIHTRTASNREISNALFEMSPSPIAICKIVGREINLVDSNYAAERIFGYTKEELIGKDIRIIMSPKTAEKSRSGEYKKILMETSFSKVNITCQAKNGTEFPVEVSAKYLSGGFVIFYIKDMTEIKFIKDHLIFLERRIADLEKEKIHPIE